MNKFDDKYIEKFQFEDKPKLLSKYRECQECKHKFVVPPTAIVVESKFPNYKIYCPRCDNLNIAVITEKLYKQK